MRVLIDEGITYERCYSGDIAVYLAGKRVGTIVKAGESGYQYVTTSGDKGEIFESRADVMKSLEGDDE